MGRRPKDAKRLYIKFDRKLYDAVRQRIGPKASFTEHAEDCIAHFERRGKLPPKRKR